MKTGWREAFLFQAASDYGICKFLSKERKPDCHWLHCLQMTTEKLAKSALCNPHQLECPRKTHKRFVKFMRTVMNDPRIQRRYGLDKKPFCEMVRCLLPIAQEIENLSPDLSTGPNPEYPWKAGSDVYVPVNYRFPEITVHRADNFNRLLKFLDVCFEVYV